MRHIHQGRQIAGTGLVAAGQPGGLHIPRIGHTQQAGFGIHLSDKNFQPARVGTAQCMGSPVLAGHERQMQHFAPRQRGPDRQARAAAFFGIHIVLGDRQGLIHGQFGLGDEHARHELGQGRNRQHRMVILAEQDLVRILVHHQRYAGLEIQRIVDFMQARNLTKRLLGGYKSHPGGRFRRLGSHPHGLGIGVGCRLARCHGALGICRAYLLLFGNGLFLFARMHEGADKGRTHNGKAQNLEKTSHCRAVAMVHQSAPNGKKC